MAGLSDTGFSILTLDDIRESMNESLRTAFGPSVDLSDGALLGQLVGIVAERVSEVWELAEAVNSSLDPDAATGVNLDSLAALTGTQREAASPSTVTLTLTGKELTLVPAGSRVAVEVTGAEFSTNADATLVGLLQRTTSTAYAIGDRRTNAQKVYLCIDPGVSLGVGSSGPTTEADSISDGSVLWRYLGDGEAAVDVTATATTTGPTVGTSGSITEIVTPVGDWEGAINVLDATVGTDIETDEALRLRREPELAATGTSPLDAIRSDLLDVEGVSAVTIFDNPTDLTNADGVPPHAFEALIQGGDDQVIRDTLLDAGAAGIGTHGTVTGTALDTTGVAHTVKFSRPQEIEIYISVTLTYDAKEYPADGDAQVKAAIVAWGDAQRTGKDVVASAIGAQPFRVPGVLDVSLTRIGIAPSPGSSVTIPITLRQLAIYDSSRVVVTSSPAVP
jgi:uncharacterized phage protein gp47/JayE